MPPPSASRVRAIAPALCAATLALRPGTAAAHVKWFCAFDVAGQPRGLATVLCPDFEQLTLLSVLLLVAGSVLGATPLGLALTRALDRAMAGLRANTETILRATCGFFFIALWTTGGILLTPELRTASPLVPWFQLAIAAGLVWRRTVPASALGILALYAVALRQYGLFHLLDYPVFPGVALYLLFTAIGRAPLGVAPLTLLRVLASVTLMWASVEKWAYPEWTFPLFATHPGMSLGFDAEFFMRAAGSVEFGLAFALLGTPLARRAAALILAGMFVGAIAEFGKLDAIGHAVIIAVLLAIAADGPATVARPWWRSIAAPSLGYAAALALTLTAYYAAHLLLFGPGLAPGIASAS